MAIHRFKGIGWFLCSVVVALACYMVTSQGAAERAKLHSVEARIVAAEKQIRDLETEYSARANMTQLIAWNGADLGLTAPNAEQFVASDVQLADYETIEEEGIRTEMAAVTPRAAPEQVAVAAAAPARIERAVAAVELRDTAVAKHLSSALAKNSGSGTRAARTTAVAMLDDKLLSSDTINELKRRAAFEQRALR
jgi:hypothetical protein